MPATVTRMPSPLPVKQIAAAAEALIELLNVIGGDPDLEESEADESEGCDRGDPAWIEWDRMAPSSKRGPNADGGNEDDEDADPVEDCGVDSCAAADDRGTGDGGVDDGQPGDAGDAEDGHDAELEQMHDCVPCVPVYALEPNIFTGERQFLGRNNLQPSFRGNGPSVRAFDPGGPPEAA